MSESNGFASREQLLAPATRRYREVVLPVRGLKLRVQNLTEEEYAAFARYVQNKKDAMGSLLKSRRALVIRCVVDGAGNLVFTDRDYDALAKWDAADLQALQEACADHCGLNDDGLENLRKNCEAITGAEPQSA